MPLADTRVLLLALFLLMTGASTAATLQGSEWRPLLIEDLSIAEDVDIFVQFRSKGRLAGFAGCNRLIAQYSTEGSHIFIGPVALTRRFCGEPAMRFEAALASALERSRSFHRDRARLVLFDNDGHPILELRQTDWD